MIRSRVLQQMKLRQRWKKNTIKPVLRTMDLFLNLNMVSVEGERGCIVR